MQLQPKPASSANPVCRHPTRLRRGRAWESCLSVSTRPRRRHAEGGLGRWHPLLRHRALLRAGPERDPNRPVPRQPAALGVRPLHQGGARGSFHPPSRMRSNRVLGGRAAFRPRPRLQLRWHHAGLRAVADAARHEPHRPLLIHDLDFWFHQTEAKVAAYLAQLFTSGWRALEQLRRMAWSGRSGRASTNSA